MAQFIQVRQMPAQILSILRSTNKQHFIYRNKKYFLTGELFGDSNNIYKAKVDSIFDCLIIFL